MEEEERGHLCPQAVRLQLSMIVRSRGYLPHIEAGETIYFVTFRLAGSLPGDLLGAWRSEKEEIIANAHQQNRKLSEYDIKRLNYLHLERIEKFLDSGKGERWLESPRIAKVVADALKYFDGNALPASYMVCDA